VDDKTLLQEALIVHEGAVRYGGRFMRTLAVLIECADMSNLRKIYRTWPEEWARYLQMGKRHQEDANS